MADVKNDLAGLTINTGEDEILQDDVADSDPKLSYENCFVGSFLTSSVIHFVSMRATLANVWHPLRGISIFDLSEGILLF
ncbi:hypothetical protein HRI_002650300 [Hibiscus trionum]|uniref:DUF4283 domain-containing protein n=1 Tax=Hibiscus trionum TaxID=183268 RepID=A0A9W7M8Z0_HIBTR|nr:hypothetical protein HRI_002650300 [Hibiscus trionum]